jgi:type IV secretory pathway VirB10-like protein
MSAPSAARVGRPFSRKLLGYALAGLMAFTLVGGVILSITGESSYEEAKRAKQASEEAALRAQPKGTADSAASLVSEIERRSSDQLAREIELRNRAESDDAERKKRERDALLASMPLPGAAPPDPSISGQMRDAAFASGGAVAEIKAYEHYDADRSSQEPRAGAPQLKSQPAAEEVTQKFLRPVGGRNPRVLNEGAVVRTVMITGINSQIPGTVIAQVSEDVYDSLTGLQLLIPRGAKFVGNYQSAVNHGQERIGVAFKRLIMTDGRSIVLPEMPGADMQGSAGIPGEYHSNFFRSTLPSVVMGLIGTLVERNSSAATVPVAPNGATNSPTVAQQVFPQVSQRLLERSSGARAYFKVPAGERFALMVTADIMIPEQGLEVKLLGAQ